MVLMTAVGPCAEISRGWNMVVQAEPTLESWRRRFEETVRRLARGTGVVDNKEFLSRYTWHGLAERLLDQYGALKAGCTK